MSKGEIETMLGEKPPKIQAPKIVELKLTEVGPGMDFKIKTGKSASPKI